VSLLGCVRVKVNMKETRREGEELKKNTFRVLQIERLIGYVMHQLWEIPNFHLNNDTEYYNTSVIYLSGDPFCITVLV
jgi:hypothetical protein